MMTAQCVSERDDSVSSPQPRISVLIDARKLDDGGIGTYTFSLIAGLVRAGLSVHVLVRSHSSRARDLPPSVKVIWCDVQPYSLQEFTFLGRLMDRGPWDLVHIPHYTLPFGISKPVIVTVHDLIHLREPSRWFLPFVARPLIGSALARASRIIAVSRATADDICATFSLSGERAEKISVIPNIRQSSNSRGGEETPRSRNMLLAVISQNKPHKGIRDLIEAFRRFSKHSPSVTLVLAGFGIEAARGEVAEYTRNLPIEVRGVVSSSERDALYQSAHAVIIPSVLEGFGLSALEGIAAGAWIVTRPVPAVREVISSRDVVARDMSVEALSEAIGEVMKKESRSAVESASENQMLLDRFHEDRIIPSVVSLYRDALSASDASIA